MIALYNYIEAKRRLAQSIETIQMMGESSNYMLEAQRDMIELEMNYYWKEVKMYPFYFLLWCLTLIPAYAIYKFLL
ncbi:hypothetical protein UFOVP250_49 [uncultured Caudovirales phage]|uniref:Uncharacterized protein n=1 Tax=uncultured Caudovirales phage TaxID=2100421 RepID=A0A6J5LHW9_9CAUD|nr:hypothetical protein UFOVP250_49 [uncultured Caudovirales phage]